MKLGKPKHQWEERFDMYVLRSEISARVSLSFKTPERHDIWNKLVITRLIIGNIQKI